MLPIQARTAPKPWDPTPDGPPVTIEARTGDQPLAIATDEGRVRVRPGAVADPDAVIAGDPSDPTPGSTPGSPSPSDPAATAAPHFLFTHAGWQQASEFISGCSTNWGAYLTSPKTGTESDAFAAYPAGEISRWD